MLVTATDTQQKNPPRPLTIGTWKKLLDVARPARYAGLVQLLEYLFDRLHILQLWREVFGETPPGHAYTYDLQCEFAGKVFRELFPVCLEDMDAVYNSGGNPFAGPIHINGNAVPWEVCPLDDLRPASAIVLACIWQWIPWAELDKDRIDMFHDDLLAVLDMYGIHDAPIVYLPATPEALLALERAMLAQAAPWPGIAGIIHGIMKDTGNEFIDWPSIWYQMEYGECWPEWFWTAEAIRELTLKYSQVWAMYAAIDAFHTWYDRTPDPGPTMIEFLAPFLRGETPAAESTSAGRPLVEILAPLASLPRNRPPEDPHQTTHEEDTP